MDRSVFKMLFPAGSQFPHDVAVRCGTDDLDRPSLSEVYSLLPTEAEMAFIASIRPRKFNGSSTAVGQLYHHAGRRLFELNPSMQAAGEKNTFLWIDEFPLFQLTREGTMASVHHPFTAPREDHVDVALSDPLNVCSNATDNAGRVTVV